MEVTGLRKIRTLEAGKIYYAVKRLIDSVWTVSYTPVENGKVYIITYDRDNAYGIKNERTLSKLMMKEDDHRTVQDLVIYDSEHSWSDHVDKDEFEIVNKRYVFSYEGIDLKELNSLIPKYPALKKIQTKGLSNKFFGESKLLGFEDFLKENSHNDKEL
jgi:hypothetical protein